MPFGFTTDFAPELPRRGRSSGAAGHQRQLRNRPTVVSEVWYRIRSDAQATAGRLGDTWHLDELFVTIQGQRQYLWRAVDQDGDVIDILVQPRRDQRAAERFFRKLLKGQEREPRRLVTDKLRTYETARRILMPSVVHDTERYANDRAEVSHEPIRQRERQMRGFKSVASSATILVGARSHSESIPSRTPPAAVSQPPALTNSFLAGLA